jgi:hypothetical protein
VAQPVFNIFFCGCLRLCLKPIFHKPFRQAAYCCDAKKNAIQQALVSLKKASRWRVVGHLVAALSEAKTPRVWSRFIIRTDRYNATPQVVEVHDCHGDIVSSTSENGQ